MMTYDEISKKNEKKNKKSKKMIFSFFVPMSMESLNFKFGDFSGDFFKNFHFLRDTSLTRRNSESA